MNPGQEKPAQESRTVENQQLRDKFNFVFEDLDADQLVSNDAVHGMPKAKGRGENEFLISLLLDKKIANFGDAAYRIPQLLDLQGYSQEEVIALAERVDSINFWSSLLAEKAIDLSALNNEQKLGYAQKILIHSILKYGFAGKKFDKDDETELDSIGRENLNQAIRSYSAHGAAALWENMFDNLDVEGLSEDDLLDLADQSHNSEIWRLVIEKISKEKKLTTKTEKEAFFKRVVESINGLSEKNPRTISDLEFEASSLAYTLGRYLNS